MLPYVWKNSASSILSGHCLADTAVLGQRQMTPPMFLTILLPWLGIPSQSHQYEGRSMTTTISRKARLGLVLLGSLLALSLGLISGPASAQAATSNYCVGWQQTITNYCFGAKRVLYQTYGWGDHGAVCVTAMNGWYCSSGPGAGVYSASRPADYLSPGIKNAINSPNFVHGVALQP